MSELTAIESASISSQESEPRISVCLPPKKRWRQQATEIAHVAPEPVQLPETPKGRLRMRKSGQPHRIYPAVVTQAAPAEKQPLRWSLLSSFPWRETLWIPAGR